MAEAAIAWIGLAISAVGAGVAVHGQIRQAEAAEDAADYNAAVAEQSAKAEQDKAQYEAQRIRKRNLLMLGKQKAAFAKSGVNISGSALDVIYDSELEGELDVLATLYSGSFGANYQRARGRLAKMEGRNAATVARYGAASTFLTGTGRLASNYPEFNTDRRPYYQPGGPPED